MQPRLLTLGGFTLYSFGAMVMLAFGIGGCLAWSEFRRKGLDPLKAWEGTLLALVLGFLGSKVPSLLGDWQGFLAHPMQALTESGLTFQAGLVTAALAILWYFRVHRLDLRKCADAGAPTLMLGYAIGRIGCHLSGDGDYGKPTTLPWACDYSHGSIPPSVAFRDCPDLVSRYGVHGVVPDTLLLHPTPLYECMAGLLLFWLLWRLRTRPAPDGWLFSLYLVLSGAERFLIEFIRLNPPGPLGLTDTQWLSLGLMALGAWGLSSRPLERLSSRLARGPRSHRLCP